MKELNLIRSALKVPKGQMNNFGGYKYRSCEDILEAVKPLLIQHNVCLTITDDMIQLGDRYYIKATVTLLVEKESISVSAFAREALTKKGMDEAQITGSASSYARKYALNGLLAIDDTKDADTMDNASHKPQQAHSQAPPAPQRTESTNVPPEPLKRTLMPNTPKQADMVLMAEIADAFGQADTQIALEFKVKDYRLKLQALPEDCKEYLRNECKLAQARIENKIVPK